MALFEIKKSCNGANRYCCDSFGSA